MLVQTVIYTVDGANVEAMKAALRPLRDGSRAEDGCLTFDVIDIGDDDHTFVLYEEWADQAALDVHFATEHFKQYGINGIRKLAKSRTAYTGAPLV